MAKLKKKLSVGLMPIVPALRGQSQADLCEFKSNLIYMSSRTAKDT